MACVVAAVLVIAIIGFIFMNRPRQLHRGPGRRHRHTHIGQAPGRVAEFYVQEGDTVKAGHPSCTYSSVVDAQLGQAEAMRTVATATDKKVDAGTRIQIIINTAASLLSQAEAAETITKRPISAWSAYMVKV